MIERFYLEGKLTNQGETIVGGALIGLIILIIALVVRKRNRQLAETEHAQTVFQQPAFPYGDDIGSMTLDFQQRRPSESMITEYKRITGLLNRRVDYLNQGIIDDKDETEKKLNEVLRVKEEMEEFYKLFKGYYYELLKTEYILKRKLNLYKK